MAQREQREEQRNVSQSTNTFAKGMDKDTDLSLIPKDAYIHAQNFRLLTSKGNTSMTLENIEGNTLMLDAGTYGFATFTIIGYTNIRDVLVLFLTNNVYSMIVTATATTGSLTNINIIYFDANSSDGSTLNFNIANPISAIGRYETALVQKVYWVDGVNPFRFVNIADPTIAIFPSNRFNILPVFNMISPSFVQFTSGSLQSGKIQYAYQLYARYGGESLFSSCSPLVSVTTSGTTSGGNNSSFYGDPIGTNTGKGVEINIPLPTNGSFTTIRVVSILYNQLNANPTINIVAEQDIIPGAASMNFFDFGSNYLGSYTFEQFAVLSTYVFSAKILETKNNYLFAGNITEQSWDVTYDARAYRFANSSENNNPNFYSNAALFNSQGRYDIVNYTTYNGVKNYYITSGVSYTGTPILVPTNHDAINPFNNVANDGGSAYLFRYQSNISTIGGSGPNISYSFTTSSSFVLDNTTNGAALITNFTDYTNPIVETTMVGYQRDEIYRFGIVFFNAIGQASTVKWIGDVRFPNMLDANIIQPILGNPVGSSPSVNGITAYPLGITFSVNTTGLSTQGAVSYQIVRVKRQSTDRTVITQGIVLPLMLNTVSSPSRYTLLCAIAPSGGTSTIYGSSSNGVDTPDYSKVEFDSPEIAINKNLSYTSGDRLDIIGELSYGSFWTPTWIPHPSSVGLSSWATISAAIGGGVTAIWTNFAYKYSKLIPIGIPWYAIKTQQLMGRSTMYSQSINPSGTFLVPFNTDSNYWSLNGSSIGTNLSPYSSYTFYNVINTTFGSSISVDSISGTKAIISLPHSLYGAIDAPSNLTDPMVTTSQQSTIALGGKVSPEPRPDTYLCNYRRMNGTTGVAVTSQYNGNTYTARQNNVYMACSQVHSVTDTTSVTVYGGDTYISMFDYQRGMLPNPVTGISDRSFDVHAIYFPVESSIDLRFRQDKSLSRIYSDANALMINELSGLFTFTDNKNTFSLEQPVGLYTYNSVYSQENTTLSYFPFNENIIYGNQTFDTRILVSNKKINGEIYDNWTSFNINNFLDVDSTYGSLNNMVQFNDLLLFWQDKAFGNISVNPRALISDNNPGQIVLGTGTVLDRFDYISTLVGNPGNTAPIHGQNGLYWYDSLGKSLYLFHGQDSYFSRGTPMPYSKIKGLSSFINDNVTPTTTWLGTYDYKYNEVIMTLQDIPNNKSYTFGYNELTNGFTGFYTFNPYMYINTYCKDYYTISFAVYGLGNNQMYLHNYGPRGTFYTITSNSSITFIVNDNYASTKVFDNLLYNTSSVTITDTLINNYADTFSSFMVYTTKQNTGTIPIVLASQTSLSTTIDMSTNTAKRENSFITNIGRNNLTIGQTSNVDITTSTTNPTRLFRERIRDKYAMVTMTYNNSTSSGAYIFSVPYVITTYRKSYR